MPYDWMFALNLGASSYDQRFPGDPGYDHSKEVFHHTRWRVRKTCSEWLRANSSVEIGFLDLRTWR